MKLMRRPNCRLLPAALTRFVLCSFVALRPEDLSTPPLNFISIHVGDGVDRPGIRGRSILYAGTVGMGCDVGCRDACL